MVTFLIEEHHDSTGGNPQYSNFSFGLKFLPIAALVYLLTKTLILLLPPLMEINSIGPHGE